MYKRILIEEAKKMDDPIYIDMRSPSEFIAGHVPGAMNIPLFNDEERASVGSIYKKIGVDDAKQAGLFIVSPKLPQMVALFSELQKTGRKIIVYCWRGGMRSASIASVLATMSIEVFQLVGGYKAFRRFVLTSMEQFVIKPRIIVICGSTGVGKTIILKRLEQQGIPVIDLEKIANHRGSVFGQIGLGSPQTAQNFDALLLNQLTLLNSSSYIVVECESKRIGNVYLPNKLYQAMRVGEKILVSANLETRVSRLMDEYTGIDEAGYADIVITSIRSLSRRLGVKKTEGLVDAFISGQIKNVISVLLREHYDPLYGYETCADDGYSLHIDVNNLEEAVTLLVSYLKQMK